MLEIENDIINIIKKHQDAKTRKNKIIKLLNDNNINFFYIKDTCAKTTGKMFFVSQGFIFRFYISYFNIDYKDYRACPIEDNNFKIYYRQGFSFSCHSWDGPNRYKKYMECLAKFHSMIEN